MLERHLHHFIEETWGNLLACVRELSPRSHHGSLLRCLERLIVPFLLQPSLVEDVPAHGRGGGTRWSLRSLPTLTILWFYDSNPGGRRAVSHTFFPHSSPLCSILPFLRYAFTKALPAWLRGLAEPCCRAAGTGCAKPPRTETAWQPPLPALHHRHPAQRNPVKRKLRTFSGNQDSETHTALWMTIVCWFSLMKSAIFPHSQKELLFSSCLKFVWSLTVQASWNWILLSEMSHCNLPLTSVITSMPA